MVIRQDLLKAEQAMTNSDKNLPDRQDIIWIDFLPTVKEEIRGRHPAVVLSTTIYTQLTGLVIVAPITHARNNRLKNFFIPVNSTGKIEGYVNPLQIFSFSYHGRKGKLAHEMVSDLTYAYINQRLKQIFSFEK